MKPLTMMILRRALLRAQARRLLMSAALGAICLTTPALLLSQATRDLSARPARPELLRLERPVRPGGAGANRLDLDVDILAGGSPFTVARVADRENGLFDAVATGGLSDLRLYDRAGREMPYLLVQPPSTAPEWAPGRVLPVARTDTTSAFEADLGAPRLVDRLRIGGIPAPFLKRVRLEGSGDREHWTLLVDEGTLFDLPDEQLRQRELEFTAGEYRYLRLEWDDRSSGRVPPPEAVAARIVRTGRGTAPTLRTPVELEKRASEPRVSRYRLKLPGARLPIVALELTVGGGNVLRQARVNEPRLQGSRVAPVPLGEATLRRAVRGDVAASALRIPIQQPTEATLDLVIDDGDNPPLDLRGVTAVFATLPFVYFESADGATLTARYGGELIAPPRYDLEAARERVPELALVSARWGPASERPASAVAGTTPLPVLGAPIDVKAFRYRREIPEGPQGLTVVPLDAAALAHTRRYFPDLRIAGAEGKQVPYLPEVLDEPLSVDLGKVEAAPPMARSSLEPEPQGTRSRYRVRLPYADLPEGRLIVTTRARVFQRRVTLGTIRPPGGNRRDPWFQRLASATWSHADPESPAPPLTLEVPTLNVTEAVLEIEEGDNSPIALDSMRLLLPAYRVRFVREGTAPLSLVYGRTDLDTPSYDLALLAPRLLGAPATELAAGPEQPVAPPAMNAMPMTVFWSILGLAVAVMLGLIARMVVKGGVPEAEPTEAEKKTA